MKSLRHYRPYLVALGLLWGLPAMIVWYATRVHDAAGADSQCNRASFGCMSPAEMVLFAAVYATPVLILLGLVACAVIILLRRRRETADRPTAHTASPR